MELMRHNCGILNNYWYAAALSEQVTPKKPLGRIIMDEMLALLRMPDGSLVCQQVERCRHRQLHDS